jgi:hypothetical protein
VSARPQDDYVLGSTVGVAAELRTDSVVVSAASESGKAMIFFGIGFAWVLGVLTIMIHKTEQGIQGMKR